MKEIVKIIVLGTMLAAGPRAHAAPAAGVDTADYAKVLDQYVDDNGLVNYAALKAARQPLDAFVASLASLDRATYDSWKDTGKLAFWLNAYNALVLRTVIDNYPIQPQKGRTSYPDNSVQQIPGVWDGKPYTVMGRKVTLNGIENDVIRAQFKEPRVHMALVCGAMSCPRLRREPYRGDALDRQLDDQARIFLTDLRNFFIDRPNSEVWVSSIFQWYVDDFAPGALKKMDLSAARKKAVLDFIAHYLDPKDADYLRTGTYTLQYFDYDWSLNVQQK